MDTLRLIGTIVLILIDIILIGIVLFQSGRTSGLGVIDGSAEVMFGKNSEARGIDAKLVKYTKIGAIVFVVISILLVLMQRYNPTASAEQEEVLRTIMQNIAV